MSRATIQFTQLEHLLEEVTPGETLRVNVLEQTKTTSSRGLTHKEISIGLSNHHGRWRPAGLVLSARAAGLLCTAIARRLFARATAL